MFLVLACVRDSSNNMRHTNLRIIKCLFNLYCLFYIVLTQICDCSVTALPLYKREVNSLEVPPPEIIRFMRRFGYLEQSPNDSESLYHESAIVEAIKNVQKYGALNQTGILDNETLNLFSKPRCGVPDIEGVPYYLAATTQRSAADFKDWQTNFRRSKRYVVGARPWSKRHITYFIANWSLKINGTQVERDIARALTLWSRYSGLRFRRINDTAADIIVGFGSRYHGDNYPFDGEGNILAHAFYPYELGSWGGDVHFDEDENWKENAASLEYGVDFFSVALHELGHSLGLAHSTVYDSVMFPYYKGPEHTTLHTDDTIAMYEMYLNKQLDDDENDILLELDNNDLDVTNLPPQVPPTTQPTIDSTPPTELSPTFHGDFETVTAHKTRYASADTTKRQSSNTTPRSKAAQTLLPSTWTANPANTTLPAMRAPNICQGHFDAVSVINGSVHIFKGRYVWRLTERYAIAKGFPRIMHELFPFLPQTVRRINAAYVRYDNMGVLFAGQSYWVFNGNQAIEDSPRQLQQLLGSSNDMLQLDAAFLWPKNNYTYLFAGDRFWRYNDYSRQLDADYPKSMQRWPGIPNNIDAAATLPNGKTYFFKNNIYWLYNNTEVRPARGYPRRASSAWLGCAAPTRTPLRNTNTTVAFISASAWNAP